MDHVVIREITSESEIMTSLQVIQKSFATVADAFALTRDNANAHPAFMTEKEWLRLKEKDAVLLGAFLGSQQIGFVAVVMKSETLYYMEKLAVLPGNRRQGRGTHLIEYVSRYVQYAGGKKISIGIIDEDIKLKNWYQNHGFEETGQRKFEHLPFTVCFMEKMLQLA